MDERIEKESMKEVSILILILYVMANAAIVYYFFIYKQHKIDKEYREQLHRIRRGYSHPTSQER
jgi:preprotein translocase subunit YajC